MRPKAASGKRRLILALRAIYIYILALQALNFILFTNQGPNNQTEHKQSKYITIVIYNIIYKKLVEYTTYDI